MDRTLDLTPLTDPVDPRELAEFAERARRDERYVHWRLRYPGCMVVFLAVVLLALSLFFAGMAAMIIQGEAEPLETPGEWVLMGVAAAIIIGMYVASGIALVRLVSDPVQTEEVFRLERFAERNGLRFSPLDPRPDYPAVAFSNRRTVVRDRLRPAEGDAFDIGLAYKPSTGENDATTSQWYIAIRLERSLPHIVLDAKGNDSRVFGSSLPGLQRDQILGLEGDFDRYFTLYCPKGYERDALYIFTPDLMALCIDEASAFDVEIIDHWMFVYSPKPPRLVDPEVQRRIFRIIDLVGAKALSRTDRYRDERSRSRSTIGKRAISPRGRRLRRTVSVSAIVIAFLVVTAPFWGFLVDWVTGH